MPRKYQKKDKDYWLNLNRRPINQTPQAVSAPAMASRPTRSMEEIEGLKPKFVSASTKEYNAGYSPSMESRRAQWFGDGFLNEPYIRFPNLYAGILPYQNLHSMIGVADAVELAQKAWANIAIVRNAIEAQVEFSYSEIHLKCSNKAAKTACEAWLKRVRMDEFQSKFYRELFRSANVFTYRVKGQLRQSLIDELKVKFGHNAAKEITVGYIILNPVNVAVKNGGIGLYQSYIKFLTSLELNTLKNSAFGLELLRQLGIDDETLKNAPYPHVFLEFDSNKIVPVFYQKQDYEPLAIPPLWALMDDLEIKLKLKRADEAVIQTVEDIILLVTHGAKEEDGGIDPNNAIALHEMFTNKAAARVLVADYTTKAEFIIPDFKMVLGEDKYKQVDKDIKEGLQVIMVGSGNGEKFSNQATQVKMFLKKLNGARKQFQNFLQDELESFCDSMGYRNVPKIHLEEIDMEDEVQFQRIVTQLLQLGILTPQDGLKVMDDGVFPSPEENLENQEEYKKQRAKGLFQPLIGGGQQNQNGRPPGTTGPQVNKKKATPIGASIEEENIQITDENAINIYGVAAIMKEYGKLYKFAADQFKKIHNKNIDIKNDLIKEIVLNTTYNSNKKDWQANIKNIIKTGNALEEKEIRNNIKNIEKEFEMTDYLASIIYHAKENKDLVIKK